MAVTTAPPPSPVFELRAGALRAAFRADLGGSLAGLWHDRTPVLRSVEPAQLEGAHGAALHPLIADANRHGAGRQRPWRIVASSPLDLVLELEHAGDDDWPFSFSCLQSFSLAPDALEARIRLVNTEAAREQPAGVGWQVWFPRRVRSRLHAEVDGRWDADATGLPARRVAQHGIDADVSHLAGVAAFDGFRGAARIRDERFSLRLESSLERLVVDAAADRDGFCVAPVSHVAGAIRIVGPAAPGVAAPAAGHLGRAPTIVALAPGATLEATLALRVAPI